MQHFESRTIISKIQSLLPHPAWQVSLWACVLVANSRFATRNEWKCLLFHFSLIYFFNREKKNLEYGFKDMHVFYFLKMERSGSLRNPWLTLIQYVWTLHWEGRDLYRRGSRNLLGGIVLSQWKKKSTIYFLAPTQNANGEKKIVPVYQNPNLGCVV